MKILSIERAREPGGGAFPCLAKFDVELTDSVRLYNLRLLRAPDGQHRVYAPSAGGKRCATFAPEFAATITEAALAAISDRESQNARHRA